MGQIASSGVFALSDAGKRTPAVIYAAMVRSQSRIVRASNICAVEFLA